MDVSTIAVNLVYHVTYLRKGPGLGRGAIIGLIDSGFELSHPAFRDSNGKTRVLAAWDQLDLGKLRNTWKTSWTMNLTHRKGFRAT
jgi:hypothetical protein